MQQQNNRVSRRFSLQEIVSFAKEYGFVYQSSDIYDGLQAVYDYGHLGTLLKNNIKDYWLRSLTQLHRNILVLDAAILMHPTVWKASGHIDSFNDPMIDNKDSKLRYRADNLIESHIASLISDKKLNEAELISEKLGQALSSNDLSGLHNIIVSNKIECEVSKSCNWTEVRQFNLMFSTKNGAIESETSTVYLRPETAQGIFVNFSNVIKSSRQKVPFGIAQIGKAFRNEVIARQFIFRTKEFEQMEMQYFVKPGTQDHFFDYWLQKRLAWYKTLNIEESSIRTKKHTQLAHYADNALDIEFDFPFGFKEIEGVHSRTNFDLSQHNKFSGKKLEYFDPELNKSYTPCVIETSCGCDRLFLAVMANSLFKEVKEKEEDNSTTERTVFKVPYHLAPYKAAILPLMKKDGLLEKAELLYKNLQAKFSVDFDDSQSIGKRYGRQDIAGTPFCITVDHETLDNDSVTLRNRDTTVQIRLKISELSDYIKRETDVEKFLNLLK